MPTPAAGDPAVGEETRRGKRMKTIRYYWRLYRLHRVYLGRAAAVRELLKRPSF